MIFYLKKMLKYDLEDRTFNFAKRAITLSNKLNKNDANRILLNQLIRSSTSIGANYREANEASTKKDFKHKIQLAKKESRETIYWLKLLVEFNSAYINELDNLINESTQIMKILAAIYLKTEATKVK
jgi:four helix bundle protein